MKLEAALELVSRRISLSRLARALRWETGRAKQASAALRSRLAEGGRRLNYSGGKVWIAWAVEHLSAQEVAAIERESINDVRLSVADAATLGSLVAKQIDARWESRANDTQRNSYSRLLRLGWAKRMGKIAAPAEAVIFSLDLFGDGANSDTP